jgi:hypothetical protein
VSLGTELIYARSPITTQRLAFGWPAALVEAVPNGRDGADQKGAAEYQCE